MENSTYHGKGFYYSPKHGTYEGYWKNGKAYGHGVTIDRFGNRMEG
jgi:hypothetical protein